MRAARASFPQDLLSLFRLLIAPEIQTAPSPPASPAPAGSTVCGSARCPAAGALQAQVETTQTILDLCLHRVFTVAMPISPVEVGRHKLEPRPTRVRNGAVTITAVDGSDRNRLRQLAQSIRDEAIPAATRNLESLADRGDPFVRHLFDASEEEEPLSETGRRLLDEAYDDIDAGRLYGQDELKRKFGL